MEWLPDVNEDQIDLVNATTLVKQIRGMPTKLTTRSSKLTPTQASDAAQKRLGLDVRAFQGEDRDAKRRFQEFEGAWTRVQAKYEALSQRTSKEVFTAVHGYVHACQQTYNQGNQPRQIPTAVLCAGGGFSSGSPTAPFMDLVAFLRGQGYPAALLQPANLASGVNSALNSLLQQLSGLQTKADDVQALIGWYQDALKHGWFECNARQESAPVSPDPKTSVGLTPLLSPLGALTLRSPATQHPASSSCVPASSQHPSQGQNGATPSRKSNQGFKTPGPEHVVSAAKARQNGTVTGQSGQDRAGEDSMLMSPTRGNEHATTPGATPKRNLMATNFARGSLSPTAASPSVSPKAQIQMSHHTADHLSPSCTASKRKYKGSIPSTGNVSTAAVPDNVTTRSNDDDEPLSVLAAVESVARATSMESTPPKVARTSACTSPGSLKQQSTNSVEDSLPAVRRSAGKRIGPGGLSNGQNDGGNAEPMSVEGAELGGRDRSQERSNRRVTRSQLVAASVAGSPMSAAKPPLPGGQVTPSKRNWSPTGQRLSGGLNHAHDDDDDVVMLVGEKEADGQRENGYGSAATAGGRDNGMNERESHTHETPKKGKRDRAMGKGARVQGTSEVVGRKRLDQISESNGACEVIGDDRAGERHDREEHGAKDSQSPQTPRLGRNAKLSHRRHRSTVGGPAGAADEGDVENTAMNETNTQDNEAGGDALMRQASSRRDRDAAPDGTTIGHEDRTEGIVQKEVWNRNHNSSKVDNSSAAQLPQAITTTCGHHVDGGPGTPVTTSMGAAGGALTPAAACGPPMAQTPSSGLAGPGRSLRHRTSPGTYSETRSRRSTGKLQGRQGAQGATRSSERPPVVLVVPEGIITGALQDLIMLLSEELSSLPVVLVMGMSASVSAFYASLPVDILSRLSPKEFHFTPLHHRLQTCWLELILGGEAGACPDWVIGPKLADFLHKYMMHYDYSEAGLLQVLHLAMLMHFQEQPAAHLLPALRNGGRQLLSATVKELPLEVLAVAAGADSAHRSAETEKKLAARQRGELESRVVQTLHHFLRWRLGLYCLMECVTTTGFQDPAGGVNAAALYCAAAHASSLDPNGDINMIIRKLCNPSQAASLPKLSADKVKALVERLLSLTQAALGGAAADDSELVKFQFEVQQLQEEEGVRGAVAGDREDRVQAVQGTPTAEGGRSKSCLVNTPSDRQLRATPTANTAPSTPSSSTPATPRSNPRRLTFSSLSPRPGTSGGKVQGSVSKTKKSSVQEIAGDTSGAGTPVDKRLGRTRQEAVADVIEARSSRHGTPMSTSKQNTPARRGRSASKQTADGAMERTAEQACTPDGGREQATDAGKGHEVPDEGGQPPSAEGEDETQQERTAAGVGGREGRNGGGKSMGVTPVREKLEAVLKLTSPPTARAATPAPNSTSRPNPRERGAKLAALALKQTATSSTKRMAEVSAGSPNPTTTSEWTTFQILPPTDPIKKSLAVRLSSMLITWIPRLLKACPFQLQGTEVFCFDDVAAIKSLVLATPRNDLQAALTKPWLFLPIKEGSIKDADDVCTSYQILEEMPDTVDVGTWFVQFCQASDVDLSPWAKSAVRVDSKAAAGSSKGRRKSGGAQRAANDSRGKGKQKAVTEEEEEEEEEDATLLPQREDDWKALLAAAARFCQAARDLQVLGLWRLAKYRKNSNSVQKAWPLANVL